MSAPQADHRGEAFLSLARTAYGQLQELLGTRHPISIVTAAGHGAWEAALVNPLAPGERVLMYETGFFSERWKKIAEAHGIEVDYLPGDWRTGVDANLIEGNLRKDSEGRIKAVCIVHNETSTGVRSDLPAVRQAIDAAGHPALLIVDVISSFCSSDYRHDEWGIDVCIGGSQKGLMLPPGLSFNALSERALEVAKKSGGCLRFFWDWNHSIGEDGGPGFISTPALSMWYGLSASVKMLLEEGKENIFDRHRRIASAVRAAAAAWGFENVSTNPLEHSDSVSALLLPKGISPDTFRNACREEFGVVLAASLGRWAEQGFRIGHLGALSEPMILGSLGAIDLTMKRLGISQRASGVEAAVTHFAEETRSPLRAVS